MPRYGAIEAGFAVDATGCLLMRQAGCGFGGAALQLGVAGLVGSVCGGTRPMTLWASVGPDGGFAVCGWVLTQGHGGFRVDRGVRVGFADNASRQNMVVQASARPAQRMRRARRFYFAIASLAGLLCSMRSLLGGRAARFVGMLSGLYIRAPFAFGALGATGGLAIDAEPAGAAVWAWALVPIPVPIPVVSKARATTVPGSALIARKCMGFSGSAAHFDRNWQALPFAFVTPENAEDSFFCGLAVLSRDRAWFFSAARAWKRSRGFCTDVEDWRPINTMVNAGWKSERNRVSSEKDKSRSGFNSERLSLN